MYIFFYVSFTKPIFNLQATFEQLKFCFALKFVKKKQTRVGIALFFHSNNSLVPTDLVLFLTRIQLQWESVADSFVIWTYLPFKVQTAAKPSG